MLSNSRDNNHKIHPPCRNTTDDTNRKRSYLTAKLFLFVCLDDNIRRRISNTGENPAFLYLVIIKEASIRLIHSPLHNLAKTWRAWASPAWVGEVNLFCLLSMVKDVDVIGACKLLLTIRSDELHRVCCHCFNTSSSTGFQAKKRLPHVGKCP